MTTAISTLRDSYQADGFALHPQSVLSPDLLERASRGLEEVRDGIYDTGEGPYGTYGDPGDGSKKLVKIEQPQLANHALREVVGSPDLGRIAAEISGASMVQVWWVQLLIKPSSPPGAPPQTNVGWHQDKSYWGDWSEDSEVFTAWIALSDVTPNAGPMIFARGSNHWGLLEGGNFFSQDQAAVRSGIQPPPGATWEEVPAILPPGGVSFHHRFTYHGSGQNTSGRLRKSLAIHMRTEKSEGDPKSWLTQFLHRPEICPVIFGG